MKLKLNRGDAVMLVMENGDRHPYAIGDDFDCHGTVVGLEVELNGEVLRVGTKPTRIAPGTSLAVTGTSFDLSDLS